MDSFFSLTPERVLAAVEQAGLETRPVCYPLNSYENRVYEVELADRSRVVAKFYRPGRWTEGQILEEHQLLAELDAEEIPICTVAPFPDGSTLHRIGPIFYSVSPRRGGRAPDELDDLLALRLGMFVGRLHNVGARKDFQSRPRLDPESYVRDELVWMVGEKILPPSIEWRYRRAAETLAEEADRGYRGLQLQRIHADLHLGNVLLRDGELRVLDFDDAVLGPPVQDLWLALPGRDALTERRREIFLEGYQRFRAFDVASLRLIEILRGLRMVRYAAWLAKRADDPAFKLGWPDFGTEDYWMTTTDDLEDQVRVIQAGRAVDSEPGEIGQNLKEEEIPLTNKDYFWDWEGG